MAVATFDGLEMEVLSKVMSQPSLSEILPPHGVGAIDCPKMTTIKSVRITALPRQLGDSLPEVWATFSDGTEKMLFTYYPDEIAFGDGELIGLTEQESLQLKGAKDRAYLGAGVS